MAERRRGTRVLHGGPASHDDKLVFNIEMDDLDEFLDGSIAKLEMLLRSWG